MSKRAPQQVEPHGQPRSCHKLGGLVGLTRWLVPAVLAWTLACTAAATGDTNEGPQLAKIFGDGMVVQRDRPVPIWGTASPGQMITVEFVKQEKTAKADGDGKWIVELEPLAAGGPHELRVGAGGHTIRLRDVLVGDVWVCSGQSNMGMTLQKVHDFGRELKDAEYPQIRLNQRRYNHGGKLLQDPGVPPGRWVPCSPKTAKYFSGLAFLFGREMHNRLKVPIGLIHRSGGGSPACHWVSRQAMLSLPGSAMALRKFDLYAKRQREWFEAKAQAEKTGQPIPKGTTNPKGPLYLYYNRPGKFFDLEILPLAPFAVRGVIWDQGESGSGLDEVSYDTMFALLLISWRQAWGQADLPFIYAQFPKGGGRAFGSDPPKRPLPTTPPSKTFGSNTRASFSRILAIPGTGMVITQDLQGGVHPSRKQPYAARFTQVAMRLCHDHRTTIYGPILADVSRKPDRIVVRYRPDTVGKGLLVDGKSLVGFTLVDEAGQVGWAKANVDGDTVIITGPNVSEAATLRYGWEGYPWANLYSQERLPAVPFSRDLPEVATE